MRSTQLVLFLVLLNVGAGIVAQGLPGDVAPQVGGDDEIEESKGNVADDTLNRVPGSELVAAFFSAGNAIQDIRNVVFYGPQMLGNLGAPGILIGGFEIVLVFVVSFDVLEAITGRSFS